MPEHPKDGLTPPAIKRLFTNPEGLLPRNAQTWFIAVLALVMLLIIVLTGRKPAQPTHPEAVVPAAIVGPSRQRIEVYAKQMDEEARRLEAAKEDLNRAKGRFEGVPARNDGSADLRYSPSAAPQKNWMEQEEEKREFASRFASNVVQTNRVEPKADRSPTIPATEPPSAASVSQDRSTQSNAPKLFRLSEGTMIPSALTNRLDGTFSGPVNCLVTLNQYSEDRGTLLVPVGSRLIGETRQIEGLGQKRLAVVFHRLLLPNGHTVDLDQFKGLNQLGETGLRDRVDNHYLQLFGVSAAIGAIAGLGQTTVSSNVSGTDLYVRGVGSSLAQSSLHILDRFLNVLPTITIDEGHRVEVYLSKDLYLPAYTDRVVPDSEVL